MKKQYKGNEKPTARERVLVLFFVDGALNLALVSVEVLWEYMKDWYKNGNDPYDLLTISQNQYALGRAEVFGMRKERADKYGR